MPSIPENRVSVLSSAPVRESSELVLYWMTAHRRPHWNFALDRAVQIARELRKPLLVLEALRNDYDWASERLHAFVLQGMLDNAEAFASAKVTYYPYVEPTPGAGRGLLEALAERAATVVTDEFPCFFLPRMQRAVAARIRTRLEVVDSNGLLPLRSADRAFARAVDFRRHLQKTLPDALSLVPDPAPFRQGSPPPAKVPAHIVQRWPRADLTAYERDPQAFLARLGLDRRVAAASKRGGGRAARSALRQFVDTKLEHYAELGKHPDDRATSELSPYLHFGHLSAHEVFAAIAEAEDFSPQDLGLRRRGQREGFWQMRPGAEAFLDQLITWRELSYNFTHKRPDDYAEYSSLPAWSLKTLGAHAKDRRPWLYTCSELAAGSTHDPLWNAAQRELSERGTLHNYLRMLWGKKVLEWSASPEEALSTLLELNNRYALDGRDPSSYSGIFWCFGRFDRAWGPERPIFGTVRYMSSESARRKLHLTRYLAEWQAGSAPSGTTA